MTEPFEERHPRAPLRTATVRMTGKYYHGNQQGRLAGCKSVLAPAIAEVQS